MLEHRCFLGAAGEQALNIPRAKIIQVIMKFEILKHAGVQFLVLASYNAKFSHRDSKGAVHGFVDDVHFIHDMLLNLFGHHACAFFEVCQTTFLKASNSRMNVNDVKFGRQLDVLSIRNNISCHEILQRLAQNLLQVLLLRFRLVEFLHCLSKCKQTINLLMIQRSCRFINCDLRSLSQNIEYLFDAQILYIIHDFLQILFFDL